MNKKAISFVEIIISISIIVLLSSVGLSYKASYDDNKFNTKVKSDLSTLNNSFLAYKQENSTLPIAKSNDNFFKEDSSYAHDASDNAFGVYGYVTSDLIPKKYLAYLPLDPRTNQFYAYGKTLDPKNLQFEFAGVTTKNNKSSTMVIGDYSGEKTVGLIREYNGPQFLYDKTDTHFPYNPTERLMTAKIGSYSGTVTINGKSNDILNQTLIAGDKIKVGNSGFANIYYSDGSRSTLEKNSNLVLTKMKYPSDSNSNLITKIKLTLNNGTIWTKATKLNPAGSEFEVSTQDATAAVRGTIFKVQKDSDSSNNTIVEVDKGKVEVINNQTPSIKESLTNQEQITSNSNSLSPAITASVIASTKEIILPSNTKPEIEKITSNDDSQKTIVIKQAKAGDIIKDKDGNNIGTCTNTKCTISSTTIIKLCRAIGKEAGTEKYNCSKKININKNFTKKDLVAKKLQDSEEDEECAMEVNLECVKNELSGSGYKLIAYAPYNKSRDFNLYKENGDTYGISNSGSTISDNGVKIETGESLKYSGLNLGNNFAIEMSVLGNDLKRTNGNYYLFKTKNNNNKLQLYNNNNKHNLSGNGNNISIGDYSGSLNKNTFYPVIYKCENGKEIISIGNKTYSNQKKCSGFDTIYIGSNSETESQWNGVIDYIKFYKKG